MTRRGRVSQATPSRASKQLRAVRLFAVARRAGYSTASAIARRISRWRGRAARRQHSMKLVRRTVRTAVVCAALVLAAPAVAQEKPQAYVNAHLIPIVGPEIDNGVLVVQGGKIVAAGKA